MWRMTFFFSSGRGVREFFFQGEAEVFKAAVTFNPECDCECSVTGSQDARSYQAEENQWVTLLAAVSVSLGYHCKIL